MKSFSVLNRKIRRLTFREPLFQFKTFTSLPSQNLEVGSIQSISENPFFRLLSLCRTLSSLQKIHALLIVNGETDDPLLKTKLVSSYGTFGRVKHARLLFDEIRNPDIDSCKVMIRWYFMNELYDEIIGFYKFMRRRFLVLDNIVLSIVLKACSELRDFVEGRKFHGYIVQLGSPDSFVLTGLVDMYAKCGEIDTARKVFERIRDRNVVCWTSMIVGYVQNNCAKEALLLFNRMRECLVEGNTYTLGSVVTACARLGALHQGKWVHGNVIKNGIEVNSYLFTSILDMYVKCAAIRDARLIFDEVSIIDLVSWTAMIVGYAQSGFAEEALLLFTDKNWQNIYPNSVTLASVLSACAQSGNPNLGSSVHGLAIKLGQGDVNVMNAVVDMYAKCSRIEDAIYLFESMVDKDVVSWNSILSGYSRNGYAYEAMRLFSRMRANCFRPDPVTLVTLLSVCASLGDIRFGSSLHAQSIRGGFLASQNIYIGTALLNLYAKCGDAKSARSVFDEMTEKNMVTWSAMIGGYGRQGNSNECLELFNDMLKENVEPTDIVFTTILSAYSHTGMIREGWRLFQTMSQAYEFNPSMRHYVCMVDLFARSGNLEEALELIEKMPIQPDCTVFGAFLHGCITHSRFDLGDMAVRKMLELHPDDAGHYMLLSNLQASKGRWRQVGELRDLMKKRGLRKQLGSSQVDLYIGEISSQRAQSFG
ncbi:pentatricopeptide repeat-containing protein At2g03380, mitochondrial [Sesamum indicum]|uniref:Pentatricopeptide repeat-containing protein At2g03380, mitochondrial n=1 Tax=Sesamum indicum TaxID=4182 RepID=A0A6I9T5B2_SESIN|nr:pentatricopeptide repeat-containing protein At2g03380, mitochondrial [Sesamum indicum]